MSALAPPVAPSVAPSAALALWRPSWAVLGPNAWDAIVWGLEPRDRCAGSVWSWSVWSGELTHAPCALQSDHVGECVP